MIEGVHVLQPCETYLGERGSAAIIDPPVKRHFNGATVSLAGR